MLRQLLALGPRRNLAEMVVPRRTFEDVVLPARTREALADALVQIEKRDLIFDSWGLGERHETGLGLAFHFAGPPGTGKTICAEAVAKSLGRPLLKVRYSEIESAWAGETGKNVVAVFREARASNAVLFFDEADSIASRRFAGTSHGFEREANQTVNILLEELEACQGVVIFATNLASNFDPAFERRIRSHVLFELPDEADREKIWRAQIHPRKTPIGSDVDFSELARIYPASGGDIRNAVLNAAQRAAAEPGDDHRKAIRRQHFVAGIERVLEGKRVMEQSLFVPSSTRASDLSTGLPRSRWAMLAAVLLLLAAGGLLGWASAVLWLR
ncbi:MAG TPA: ATP-binding protein [Thermoanaerobaculia bacterium]|nr:ATP-binding protein [Thermoanaerobaculia bacterium]